MLLFLPSNHEGNDAATLSLKEKKENANNLSVFINDVLKNYDRKVRPNAGGKSVMVLIEFKVISFGEIREANMVRKFVEFTFAPDLTPGRMYHWFIGLLSFAGYGLSRLLSFTGYGGFTWYRVV
jgi:hypothetical protein